MRPITLVIPAAGLGSRFRNVGITTSKPLIPVLDRPMIEWVIGNFPLAEGDTLVIVSQKIDNLSENLNLHQLSKFLEIKFIEIDGITSGPASTVALSFPHIDLARPLIVANSDQYVSAPLNHFVDMCRFGKADGLILTMEATGNKWSFVGRDTQGNVSSVKEKEEISNEATVGIYAWKTGQLCKESIELQEQLGEKVNNEYYVAPTYNFLIQKNLDVATVDIGNHGDFVHGLGTPEDLKAFLANPKVESFLDLVATNLEIQSTQ